jgi:uncharacterized protein with FMN-binding domain
MPVERAPVGDLKQNRRRTNGLVALSSAAVLTVYTAGYFKTRVAANQLEGEAARRRTAAPVAVVASAAPAPAPAAVVEPAIGAAPDTEVRLKPDPTQTIATTTIAPAPKAQAPKNEVRLKADTTEEVRLKPDTTHEVELKPDTPVVAAPVAAAAVAPLAETVAPAAPQIPAPATEGAQTPQPGDAVPIAYKDGKYYGWGSCRHGRIQARVIVEGGRITGSAITKCETRYDCSWIKSLVPQVVARQSADIDYVTGATESADAFYYAVVEALKQAK